MASEFSRAELLLGKNALQKLNNAKVAVFGVGGVGSFVAEGLARCGVGKLVLVDHDCICITNINRQLHALHSTIGMPKVEVMKQRILDINPEAEVTIYKRFYDANEDEQLISNDLDYIVDAIDTVKSKIALIVNAKKRYIPIISSMGAGNKLDPTRFEVADIYRTSVCPLAKVMRHELKKQGINSLKVVYSKEEPIKLVQNQEVRPTPGSVSFVPSVVGLIIAGEVIKDLISE